MSNNNLKTDSTHQDLFVELNAQHGEVIRGGINERFQIANETGYVRIPYGVDGTKTRYPNPGQVSIWNTNKGGTISFDYDFLTPGVQLRQYDLSNKGDYAFRLNTQTAYLYDIELYRIGTLG